jgi:hypothetical protein
MVENASFLNSAVELTAGNAATVVSRRPIYGGDINKAALLHRNPVFPNAWSSTISAIGSTT